MSRRGDCCDNAVAESFWGTPKNELADEMDFDTRVEARRAICTGGIPRSAVAVPVTMS